MTGLTIGSETFEVRVDGDPTKPALLLSNALGTNLSMWDAQLPELTKHFRVIRYDSRGHGGSPIADSPTSIAELGGDVLAILDALDIEKTHVLGLSMGGAVAIWLLANAPEKIDRAVLASTAPRLGSSETWNRRIAAVLAGDLEANATTTIERWFSADFAAREPERVRAIYDMLCNASPRGYANACAAIRDMDLQSAVATIENDVLVLGGRDDPTVSVRDAQALAAGIAGARHVTLAARHMINIEARDAFNAAVIAFLTEPNRRSARARTSGATTASPTKRGGAGRRSNAARSPLKKTPAKRRTAEKSSGRTTATKAEAHKRPAKPRSPTRRAEPKAASKSSAKTASLRKATAARRKTPTAKARGAVTKAKTTKKAAKRATRTTKSAAKTSTTKKLPTTRRKPAGKPRRPSGRRKT